MSTAIHHKMKRTGMKGMRLWSEGGRRRDDSLPSKAVNCGAKTHARPKLPLGPPFPYPKSIPLIFLHPAPNNYRQVKSTVNVFEVITHTDQHVTRPDPLEPSPDPTAFFFKSISSAAKVQTPNRRSQHPRETAAITALILLI